MAHLELPKPECKYGYPQKQLKEILGDRVNEFNKYVVGQTGTICNGKIYNYDKDKYEPSGCGPHGIVTYMCDVRTFLENRPTLD